MKFFPGREVVQDIDGVTLRCKVYPFGVFHAKKYAHIIRDLAASAKMQDLLKGELKSFQVAEIPALLVNSVITECLDLVAECTVCEVIETVDGKEVLEKLDLSDIPHYAFPKIVEAWIYVNFMKGKWKHWTAMLDIPLEKITGEKSFLSNIVLAFASKMESPSEKS